MYKHVQQGLPIFSLWNTHNTAQCIHVRRSLSFKTADWTMELWSYIAYGLKIKVHEHTKSHFGTN